VSSHTVTAPARRSTARPPDRILHRATVLAAAAALGGFLFGYDSAVINGAVTGIQDRFRVGATETGTVVAVASSGSRPGRSAHGSPGASASGGC
jgi:SP family sugar:H+ symporter-like MFS transporter